jgi:hypothetical protein
VKVYDETHGQETEKIKVRKLNIKQTKYYNDGKTTFHKTKAS